MLHGLLTSRRLIAARLLAILVAGWCLVGCRPGWHALRPWKHGPGTPPIQGTDHHPTDDEELSAKAIPTSLTLEAWVPAFHPKDIVAAGEGYRWRNPGVEELIAAPAERRPDFARLINDSRPAVAANAAIGMARLGDDRGLTQLIDAVHDTSLKLPMRRAAAEAIATLAHKDNVRALGALRKLLDEYGADGSEQTAAYSAGIHAELLRGMAQNVDAANAPRFTSALANSSAEVRLAALAAWAESQQGELPLAAADLRSDQERRVRVAALAAIAARRPPQAIACVRQALNDSDLEVRVAAIAALGRLGGEEAKETLSNLQKHDSEIVRMAVVGALAELGADDLARASASDKAWRVRASVADMLGRAAKRRADGTPTPEEIVLARQLVHDPSAEVHQRIVAAVQSWSLEQAGPVLLAALEDSGYQAKKLAAEQLAQRWPAARGYSVDLPKDRREAAIADLKKKWHESVGKKTDDVRLASHTTIVRVEVEETPQAITPERIDRVAELAKQLGNSSQGTGSGAQAALGELKGMGSELVPLLERLLREQRVKIPSVIYHEVLPSQGAEFVAVDQLSARDVAERRRGAERLARLAIDQPLNDLTIERMSEIGSAEGDVLVCRSLLSALAHESSEPATRLAYAALSHTSGDIRRLGCEYLTDHPKASHAQVLLPALDDGDTTVVLAAARALGRSGALADPTQLERLLTTSNKPLRLEVAISLARLKAPTGPVALVRLAQDQDMEIRRQAAAAMGLVPDRSYTATLIGMLDDGLGVRGAALSSLVKVVGRDIGVEDAGASPTMQEKIARWKRWWEREQAHQSES